MRLRVLAIIAFSMLLTGCTSMQLKRSMVSQASTVMDIEYQMVLDNIAMFRCSPSSLPWHVRIKDGVVQVNDQGGIEGLGVQWGATSNFTRGPQALRSVTEQWGADAVTNPRIVKKLQDVYREVLGLPPEPDPLFFGEADSRQSLVDLDVIRKRRSASESADQEEIPPGKMADDDESRPGGSGANSKTAGDDKSTSPAQWPEFEIPTGWFHVGRKCDVPKGACYVGHHCDCYVWVMRDGVDGLSRFSLVILAITNSQTRVLVDQGLTFTR